MSQPTLAADAPAAADVIHLGGDIVTMNDAPSTVEALAVKDGVIAAAGSRSDIESM